MLDYLATLRPQLDVLGRWAFLPNAKTGSTSITGGVLSDRVIMYHRGPQNWERVWSQVIAPRAREVVWFTVVRNPWDRLVASYHFLKARGSTQKAFRDWVRGIDTKDHFCRPQCRSFMFQGRRLPFVEVLPYEQLDGCWVGVAQRIGCAPVLPRLNTSEHDHYTTYYDKATTEWVRVMYQREIAALGYEFGP